MEAHYFFAGLLLAFTVFGATLFSLGRGLSGPGWLNRVHLICGALVLLIMAGLGLLGEGMGWIIPLIQLCGALLAISALCAIILERGWAKLCPAPQMVLGAAVAAGAPFGG